MEPVRYGILGCGKHALQSPAKPAILSSFLELAALCDLNPENMAQFEQSLGLGSNKLDKFTDREEFMQSKLDAILICTQDEYHFQDLKDAIDHGLHAFVEKPVAVTESHLNLLLGELTYAANLGLIVSSCHPRRYDPPFVWLKENVGRLTRELGQPITFWFDFSYHKPSNDWKHNRGLLLDHANHEIDLLHYLFGHEEFDAVRLADSPTNYRVEGRRDGGMSFRFSGTRALESREYLEWAGIKFERGSVTVDAHKGTAIINKAMPSGGCTLETIGIRPTNYEYRGRATLENFAKAIRKEEPCYLTFADLYANTALSVMLTENERWRYGQVNMTP